MCRVRRRWAQDLAESYGYIVRFEGLGGGALDEVVPYGKWQGAGPQTQVAIFERLEHHSEHQAQVQKAAAHSQQSCGGVTVFWSSKRAM